MKLEIFQEQNKKKTGIIVGIVSIILLLAAVFLYRTYSIYQETQEFDAIKGSVPDQNYDAMYSFVLEDENGNKTAISTIPEGKDYKVSITCDNGATGSWNYDTWGPVITNLTNTRTKCTISFSAEYKERILNGMDPVLKEGLIPVTISDDGTVHKANIKEEWYSYTNQRWANAVILEDESVVYENGAEIPESNIESYFVWIPRYKYKLFNLGEYTGLTSLDSKAVQTIDVVFGRDTTDDSREGECTTPMLSGETGNCKVGDYMSHPAFLAFNVNGLWVGKFETGYKGATSTTEGEKNENNSDKVEIKPNVYSWGNIQVANAHLNAYNYKREYDSHMMKNTEWGAVAYLQHSVYGSKKKLGFNNNSNYITGYAAKNEPTTGNSVYSDYEETELGRDGTNTYNYRNPLSVSASTTNNYSGVYDMNGGTWEYMMAVMVYSDGQPCAGANSYYTSGFVGPYCKSGGITNGESFPEEKYYDKYSYSTVHTTYNRRILGDATGEMGPFFTATYGNQTVNIGSWYNESGGLPSTDNSWITRGGRYSYGINSGQFNFSATLGSAHGPASFRIVLSF